MNRGLNIINLGFIVLLFVGCGQQIDHTHADRCERNPMTDTCQHIQKNSTQTAIEIWSQQAKRLDWFKLWDEPLRWNEPFAAWFAGGTLNASHVCLDVHVKNGHGKHDAIIWESERGEHQRLTYQDLFDEVNRCAFVLHQLGVGCGTRVVIYMPMIPQALIAMLAVARLGGCHCVVFSGFSSTALKDRIQDMKAEYIITADFGVRRGKVTPLKSQVDEAVRTITEIKKVVVFAHDQDKYHISGPLLPHDVLYNNLRPSNVPLIKPVQVKSEDPLFVLYTSGTTGKPKGIMHSTGGYLTHCFATFDWAFGPRPDDMYWCTADIGWITGHSYVAYAPLMHGISIFMFEGAPDYPDPGIWWSLIEKYKINIFYTAPTALRLAIKSGNEWPKKYNLNTIRVLGTVGEPINPDVWKWYHSVIGGGRSDVLVIDTWWQTETGGFMISPRASDKFSELKPGSAMFPLPGVFADVVDNNSNSVPADTKGYLVIKHPWAGMTIGILNDPERFKQTYWSKFPGMYYTGDYAIRDKDGYYWLLGRADEVLNLSGHRVGTAEIESAAISHEAVAEAAAIGIPDEIRGEKIVLFVSLKSSYNNSDMKNEQLTRAIIESVRTHIGSFVTPWAVYYVDKLPKTRSGKIMRRLLKSVLEGKHVGDITTLEDEASFQDIQKEFATIKQAIDNRAYDKA